MLDIPTYSNLKIIDKYDTYNCPFTPIKYEVNRRIKDGYKFLALEAPFSHIPIILWSPIDVNFFSEKAIYIKGPIPYHVEPIQLNIDNLLILVYSTYFI